VSNFWSKALGVTPAPPSAPPAAPPPASPGAWWQTSPVSHHAQAQVPPEAYQHQGSGVQHDLRTLKAMRADEMSQEDMEALALLELQGEKYNQACPQCGSDNFLPRGTRVGTARMGTDKCFDCGASSSTLTASPEPAHGGTTGKAGRATKQTAHGGQGILGRHHSQLPTQYLPRQ
jgi:hypothetical protein